MVWIHGGGFYEGSGDPTFYGPDYILKKDVVLVTLNYRLGALGTYFIISTFINYDYDKLLNKINIITISASALRVPNYILKANNYLSKN